MKDFVKNLPDTPGIYKMLDAAGKILYVGKAKKLRTRVKQYFQKEYEHSTRTQKMIAQVKNIETIETDTELEALLLESNLIKELRPKYNILMKDDKSFVYIKVDLGEDFPRIRVVRERDMAHERKAGTKAKYFGPKLASSKVYDTLRILKKLFPFRHCNLDIAWKGTAENSSENLALSPNKNLVEVTNRVIDFPCLDYFIKRCPGPCIGAVSPIEYKKVVQQIVDFLEGKNDELEKSLRMAMTEAASQKLFEKAAKIRDKLLAIESITERQNITDPERRDTDVINFTTELGRVYFAILMIRNGKLIAKENFVFDAFELSATEIDLNEIMGSCITQYYERAAEIPEEIFIPAGIEDQETLETWLKQKRGARVKILNPQKGSKNHLLELAHKNAVTFSKQYRIKWLAEARGETALARLGQVLQGYLSNASARRERAGSSEGALKSRATEREPSLLKRIEGYDISHLGGNETVGSMVAFENGAAKSAHYRHFKIRTVSGKPDDYRCMEEVLMRRLKYLAKKQAPDVTIKGATKQDFAEIERIVAREEETLTNDNLQKKDFIAAKNKNELIGFGRVFALDPKVPLISTLWVRPDMRGKRLGYVILDKLIAKSNKKRLYLKCGKELENYYAEYGFVAIREAPEVLKKRIAWIIGDEAKKGRVIEKEEIVCMAYDVKKHKSDPSFSAKPDLIVVDGGKGQLGAAVLVLKKLQLEIPVISLAKRLEEIFIPGEKAPLLLEEGDEALKLLQRIRDESHRFAITFQRELHRKNLLH